MSGGGPSRQRRKMRRAGRETLGRDTTSRSAPSPLAQEAAAEAAEFVAGGDVCANEACGHPGSMHEGDDNAGACSAGDCECDSFALELADDEATASVLAAFQVGTACTCEHALADHPAVGACSDPDCACDAYTQSAETLAEVPPVPVAEVTVPPSPAPVREETTGSSWTATFCPEGRPTDDGRIMAPGAISWRELPLSLMVMFETQEGHDGAYVGGRIDNIWRDEGASLILASGVFDGGDNGREAERLVADRTLRGLSVDLAIRESVIALQSSVLDDDGQWKGLPAEDDEVDIWDLLLGETDEPILFVVTDAVIGAATVCPFPAFAEAEISLVAAGGLADWAPFVRVTVPADIRVGDDPALEGLTAAAAGLAPARPPAAWFDDPALAGLTALTVDDDGRIYGHIAPWDTCHIGIPGVCTTAPSSRTDYSFFHLGELELDDGSRMPVGKITLDTGHADRRLGWQKTVAHYDDTGKVVAYVRAGEDEHGIWVSGAIDPDLPANRVRELRAAVPSGDWRDIGGNLEMVAVLAVNVPGFPVPRSDALLADGRDGPRVLALVAAGHGPAPFSSDEPPDSAAERLRAIAALADGRFDEFRSV
jgi:hypothetical protein